MVFDKFKSVISEKISDFVPDKFSDFIEGTSDIIDASKEKISELNKEFSNEKIEKITQVNKLIIYMYRLGFISNLPIKSWYISITNPDTACKKIISKYREEIISYQILKGIIKDRKSVGAGNLGPRTTKNIELSYALYINAKETYTGEKSQLLLKEEKSKTFVLGEFLRKYGLPEHSYKLAESLIYNSLAGNTYGPDLIEEKMSDLIGNLILTIRCILHMESRNPFNKKSREGGYKYDKNRISTAKSYFQYLDGFKFGKQGKAFNRKKGNFSPLGTGLNRGKRYYETYGDGMPEYMRLAFKHPRDISPIDLTAEQSINKFLTDMFYKKGFAKLLKETIMKGKKSGMHEIYARLHHTSPDGITNKNLNKAVNIYGSQLKKIV